MLSHRPKVPQPHGKMSKMETKICIICGKEKPLEEFTKCAKSPDGRGSYCKVCHKTYTKQWNAGHPEQVKKNRNSNNAKHRPASFKIYAFGFCPVEYTSDPNHVCVRGGLCHSWRWSTEEEEAA